MQRGRGPFAGRSRCLGPVCFTLAQAVFQACRGGSARHVLDVAAHDGIQVLAREVAARQRRPAGQSRQRYTSTGNVECASTFCVWLPSSRAAMPLRPCEDMAIRSQP